MAIGKCLECDAVADMTEDHVVPQWFNKALLNFSLPALQTNLVELVCKKCNSNKGGKIDFDDPRVRDVMKKFTLHFISEIRKREQFIP